MRYLALTFFLTIACSCPAQGGSASEADNGPTEYRRLEEQWRLGSESDPIVYGVTGIRSGSNERVYILNALLHRIQIYDKSGRFIRSVLRKGEGPGDVNNPLEFCFTGQGNICVLQTFPSKLVVVDTLGNYVDLLRPKPKDDEGGDFIIYRALIPGKSNHLLGISFMKTNPPASVDMIESIWKLNGSFDFEKELVVKRTHYELQHYELREVDVFNDPWQRIAIDREGNVYYAPYWDGYRITKYDSSGRVRPFVEREYECLPRDDSIMKSVRESLERSPVYGNFKPSSVRVEKCWPDIISMNVRGDELWVLTSRGFRTREEGEIYRYEVFDLDGNFVKRVSLRGPAWNEYPAVYFLEDGRVALSVPGYEYEGSEDVEEKIIICGVEVEEGKKQ